MRTCRHFLFLLCLGMSLAACGRATSESEPPPTAAQWSSPTAFTTISPTTEPAKSAPTEEPTEVSVPEPTAEPEPTTAPEPTATPEPTAAEEPAPEPSREPDETPPAASPDEAKAPQTHVVQAGENLYRIGLRYNCPWDSIARANGIITPNRIYAGQTLTIPSAESASAPALPASHTVRPGENLFRIGLHYGVPWPFIAEANGITNPDRILAGTTLIIPVVEK